MVASCLANMDNFYIQKYISHGITPNPKNRNKFILAFRAWCEKSWLSDIKKLWSSCDTILDSTVPRPHSPWDSHHYPSPYSASNAFSCTARNFWIYANRGMHFLTFSLTCENSENQIKIPRPLLYSLMIWTSWNLHASMKCPQNYATGTGSHFDSSCEVSGDANWHVKSQLHSVATWILCQTSEALAYINQHTQSGISRFLQ